MIKTVPEKVLRYITMRMMRYAFIKLHSADIKILEKRI